MSPFRLWCLIILYNISLHCTKCLGKNPQKTLYWVARYGGSWVTLELSIRILHTVVWMQSGQNVHTHNKTVKSHGDTNKWSLLNDTGAINKVTLRTRNHVEAELECDCSPFGNGFLKFWRTAERANPATEIRVLFELKKCCVNRARKILLALRSHRRRKRLFFFLYRFFSCDEYFLPVNQKWAAWP